MAIDDLMQQIDEIERLIAVYRDANEVIIYSHTTATYDETADPYRPVKGLEICAGSCQPSSAAPPRR